ncbi:MAG: ABC transporter related protein [Synergistales bacterium 58_81]|nr:MAG: ABC transporter related protein [Synergistales bacterium 58_81]
MTGNCLVRFSGVSYTYPGAAAPAIADIDLEIASGEWMAVLGCNGSGKSTLAKHLNALLVPAQGDCFVDELNTRSEDGKRSARRAVSMVFQNPENQIIAAVVEEDVAFGPENLGLPPEEIRERVRWALDVSGLGEMARKPVYALSGGQKQRLAVAGAIAQKPPCLVLDEATTMLDPRGRQDLMEVLSTLHSDGMTLVSITHRLEEILRCDRCIVLSKGRISWSGTPRELFLLGEELDRWGLEIPGMVKVWRELVKKGLLKAEIPPRMGEMVEALCR